MCSFKSGNFNIEAKNGWSLSTNPRKMRIMYVKNIRTNWDIFNHPCRKLVPLTYSCIFAHPAASAMLTFADEQFHMHTAEGDVSPNLFIAYLLPFTDVLFASLTKNPYANFLSCCILHNDMCQWKWILNVEETADILQQIWNSCHNWKAQKSQGILNLYLDYDLFVAWPVNIK